MNTHKHITFSATVLAGLLVLAFGWALSGHANASAIPARLPAPSSPNAPGCVLGWYTLPSPNAGSGNNYISSIDVISANDVWAVGYSQNGTSTDTLTMHWDGAAWTIVPSPSLGTNNDLTGVSAVSSSDVWAVGNYMAGTVPMLYTMHWDGTLWNVVPNPAPGSNYAENLQAVVAISSNDVWALGFYRRYGPDALMMHWDGTQWSLDGSLMIGYTQLMAGKAFASNDVWAVGVEWGGASSSKVIHWDGTIWTPVPVPDIGTLNAVGGSGPNDVWAVSSSASIRWNGSAWSIVATPGAGNLYGVTALSTTDAWAVGDHIEHWDGASWNLVGTPLGTLSSIDALSSTDIWVGGYYTSGGRVQTLILRYSTAGPCTTPTATPTGGTPTYTPTPTPTRYADLTGSVQWAYTCTTAPVLLLTTHLEISAGQGIGATTMRLLNNNGDTQDFPVPPLNYHPYANTYTYGCTIGTCLPESWVTSMPVTLTVDVLDQVQESNENNNNYRFNQPPPTCTSPTATETGTPGSPTTTPTATSTPTVLGEPTVTPTGGTPPGTYTPTATATATVTATPTQCVFNFSDVQPGDYFYTDVQCVYCLGAVSGYSDGTFRPFNNTTRGQMTKIIVLALQMPIATPTGTPTFSDVPADSPFYAYVETAAAAQVVSGYADGTFRPNAPVTRGQLSKIVILAANRVFGWAILNPTTPSFSDVPAGSPFYAYIETADCHQVISGYADGTFRPGNDAIRAQIAKIVCRTAQNVPAPCTGGQ